MKRFIILSAVLLFFSCATSNIVQVNDEYIIFKEGGTPVLGQTFQLSSLKVNALNEANEKCKEQNKTVSIVEEDQTEMSIGVFARYELKFKCI